MSKKVTFDLGPAVGLASRTLVIRPIPQAGDDTIPVTAVHNADAGSTATSVTVTLADSTMFEATLADVKSSGEASTVKELRFHTGSLQYPGPYASHGNPPFGVYAMEDMSSSSSSSSQSSSSSVSSSSSSASSASSSSASSASSSSSSQSA